MISSGMRVVGNCFVYHSFNPLTLNSAMLAFGVEERESPSEQVLLEVRRVWFISSM